MVTLFGLIKFNEYPALWEKTNGQVLSLVRISNKTWSLFLLNGREAELKCWKIWYQQFSECRAYRALYILNWIYRYFTELHFSRWIGMSQKKLVKQLSCVLQSLILFLFSDSLLLWTCPNCSLCRLLLLLLHQVLSESDDH